MAAVMLRIICIEDDPDDVELIRLALARAGMPATLTRVDSEAALLGCLPPAASEPDVLLCDCCMAGFSAERALAMLDEGVHGVPLVLVTGVIDENAVVNLFRAGAKDYVAKRKLALLPAVIERVLRDRRFLL